MQNNIGLSAPQVVRRGRVLVETWDIDGDPSSLGHAEFTATEARSFAASLIAAADESEHLSHPINPSTARR